MPEETPARIEGDTDFMYDYTPNGPRWPYGVGGSERLVSALGEEGQALFKADIDATKALYTYVQAANAGFDALTRTVHESGDLYFTAEDGITASITAVLGHNPFPNPPRME